MKHVVVKNMRDLMRVVLVAAIVVSGLYVTTVVTAGVPGIAIEYGENMNPGGAANGSLWVTGVSNPPGGIYNVTASYSDDNGTTWTEEVVMADVSTSTPYPAIALDSFGDPHMIWTDHISGVGEDEYIYYANRTGGTWSSPYEVFTDNDLRSGAPDIAVDGNDTVHLMWDVYTTIDDEQGVMYRSKTSGGLWSAEQMAFGPREPAVACYSYSSLGIDSSGGLYAAVTMMGYGSYPDTWSVVYKHTSNGTWGANDTAEILTNINGIQGPPSIVLDSHNIPHISWVGQGWGANFSSFNVAYTNKNGGSWSTVEAVTDTTAMTYLSSMMMINDEPIVYYSSDGFGANSTADNIVRATRSATDTWTHDCVVDTAFDDKFPMVFQDVDGCGYTIDFGSGSVTSYVFDGPAVPTSLLCGGQTNPSNVVAGSSPTFVATYTAQGAHGNATYYQVQIGNDTTWDAAELWDSGKQSMTPVVSGNPCSAITYAGPSFQAGTYYWRIRFWDEDGYDGVFSSPNATYFTAVSPDGVVLVTAGVQSSRAAAEGSLWVVSEGDGPSTNITASYSTDNGGNWTHEVIGANAYYVKPSIAMSDGGVPHVAWEYNEAGNNSIYYANRNGGSWSAPQEAIPTLGAGYTYSSPMIALDSTDDLHLAYAHVNFANRTVVRCRTRSSWGTWGSVEEIFGPRSGSGDVPYGTMVVDSDDEVHVAVGMSGYGTEPLATNIVYKQTSNGTWGANGTAELVTNVATVTEQNDAVIVLDSQDVSHVMFSGDGWGTNSTISLAMYSNRYGGSWATPEFVYDNDKSQVGSMLMMNDEPIAYFTSTGYGGNPATYGVFRASRSSVSDWTRTMVVDTGDNTTSPAAIQTTDGCAYMGIPGVGDTYVAMYLFDGPGAPTGLLCDGETNPTDMLNGAPVFSAVYNSLGASGNATDYQVQVLEGNATATWNSTLHWDSGQQSMADVVVGGRCANITYSGPGLAENTTYCWRIKFWDDKGHWSAPAGTSFSMNATLGVEVQTIGSVSSLNSAVLSGRLLRSSNPVRYTFEWSRISGGIYTQMDWSLGMIGNGTYFNATLSGLDYGQTYYYRAKCQDSVEGDYGYGVEMSFATSTTSPGVRTLPPDSIAVSSARFKGYLLEDGGETCQVRSQYGTPEENFGNEDDFVDAIDGGPIRLAQTFVAERSYTVSGVALKIYRDDYPGAVIVSLWDTIAGVPNTPLCANSTYNGATLSEDSPGDWISFDWDPAVLSLVGGTTYAIVVTASSASATDMVYWRLDSNNGYANGTAYYYNGTAWSIPNVNWDFNFGLFSDWVNTPWDSGYTEATYFIADVDTLTRDTVYRVRAQASNVNGVGSGSSLAFVTDAFVYKPTELMAIPIQFNAITLGWTKGPGAHKTLVLWKIGDYPLSYADSGDGVSGGIAYFGTGTAAILPDLQPGVTYYFAAWSYTGSEGYLIREPESGNYTTGNGTNSAIVFDLSSQALSTTSGYYTGDVLVNTSTGGSSEVQQYQYALGIGTWLLEDALPGQTNGQTFYLEYWEKAVATTNAGQAPEDGPYDLNRSGDWGWSRTDRAGWFFVPQDGALGWMPGRGVVTEAATDLGIANGYMFFLLASLLASLVAFMVYLVSRSLPWTIGAVTVYLVVAMVLGVVPGWCFLLFAVIGGGITYTLNKGSQI